MSYINLSGTHFCDEDLAELGEFTDVDVLDLSGTRVTDAGLRHLRRLTRLQVLVLDGNQVTEAGIADLRRALPELSIVVSRFILRVDREHTANRVLGIPDGCANRGMEFIPFSAQNISGQSV